MAAAKVLTTIDLLDMILVFQDGLAADLLPFHAWNIHHPRLHLVAPSFDIAAADLRQLDRLLGPWYRAYGLRRLHSHLLVRFPHWASGWICQHAAWSGNLAVLRSLSPCVLASTSDVLDIASAARQLHVLAALSHLSVSSRAFDWAAGHGYLDMIQWLAAARPSPALSISAIVSASTHGHLHVVQFLLPFYAEPTQDAMNAAAMHGHLNIVIFLHTNEWHCSTLAMDMAAHNGHLNIVQFLHAHRPEGATTHAMDYAAKNGHLEVVKFLHRHRSEGCTTNALMSACQRHHDDVVRFLTARNARSNQSKADSIPNQCLRWILSV
ncbi:hypothetical protein DYB30_013478 [Aphanomyces astaci]|uniref:Uncharacterized protein n=1 Tax=Aphanomyces astaci TaxID=112090 RepID=A0A397DJ43_APHAT|nr:hypothetical protein DYB30_013478 [Aphanomyces astaci]